MLLKKLQLRTWPLWCPGAQVHNAAPHNSPQYLPLLPSLALLSSALGKPSEIFQTETRSTVKGTLEASGFPST